MELISGHDNIHKLLLFYTNTNFNRKRLFYYWLTSHKTHKIDIIWYLDILKNIKFHMNATLTGTFEWPWG